MAVPLSSDDFSEQIRFQLETHKVARLQLRTIGWSRKWATLATFRAWKMPPPWRWLFVPGPTLPHDARHNRHGTSDDPK
jgi:hypothetical protein